MRKVFWLFWMFNITLSIVSTNALASERNTFITSAHDTGVWIVNERTGFAKFCFISGDRPNYRITCINEENSEEDVIEWDDM